MAAQMHEKIGVVVEIHGSATATAENETREIKVGDIIYRNDVVMMDCSCSLKVLMIDGSFAGITGEMPFDFSDYFLVSPEEHPHANIEALQTTVTHGIDPVYISDAINKCRPVELLKNNGGQDYLQVYHLGQNHYHLPESGYLTNGISSEPPTNPTTPLLRALEPPPPPPSPPPPPPEADLSVRSDFSEPPIPGAEDSYVITITNHGPDTVTDLKLTESLPSIFSNVSFTPSVGTYDSLTGEWSGINLANGQSITLIVTGMIDPDATGSITNLVSVNPLNVPDNHQNNNQVSDSDLLTPQVSLSITKIDPDGIAIPGALNIYHITVTNEGPSTIHSVQLIDNGALGKFVDFNFLHLSVGSINSSGVWTGFSLATGQTINLDIQGTIVSSATGILTNTITVLPPAGVTNTSNSSSSTSVVTVPLTPEGDVSITKTSVGTAVPGETVTYTITVHNAGPSDLTTGATVTDDFNLAFTHISWTASGTLGTSFTNNGTVGIGNEFSDTVNIPVNGSITYTFTAEISPSVTGDISNSATVTPHDGFTDTKPDNNTSIPPDVIHLTPEAKLTITKSDGVDNVIAGNSGTYTYTIIITNIGSSDAYNVVAHDILPSQGFNITATTGATFDPYSNTWNVGTIAAGDSITLTLTGTVPSNAIGDNYINQVIVTSDDASTVSGSDTDALLHQGDLIITKTSVGTVPGEIITYTVTVENQGPSDVINAEVKDILPGGLSNITWSADNNTSGTGNIDKLVNIASGGSITYTITATIDPNLFGVLNNTATITAPNEFTDSDPNNNSSTNAITLTPQYDLSITKTDNINGLATPGYTEITYTIIVSNTGPSAATGVSIIDMMSSLIGSDHWTASVTAGTASGFSLSGSGNINDTHVILGSNSTITYTVTASVLSSATGQLMNTASVSGVNDTNSQNNSSTDTITLTPQCDLSVLKTITAIDGDIITYTITVKNIGFSDASNVIVNDNLYSSLSFGTVTAGATVTQNYHITIDDSTGYILNIATVNSDTVDFNPNNNSSSAEVFQQCMWMPEASDQLVGNFLNGYPLHIQADTGFLTVKVLQLPTTGTVKLMDGSSLFVNQILTIDQFNHLIYQPLDSSASSHEFIYSLLDGTDQKAIGILDFHTSESVEVSATIGDGNGGPLNSGNQQVTDFLLPSNINIVSDFSVASVTITTDFQFSGFPQGNIVPINEQTPEVEALLQNQVSLFINIGGTLAGGGQGQHVTNGIEFTILHAPDSADWNIVNNQWSLNVNFNDIVMTNDPSITLTEYLNANTPLANDQWFFIYTDNTGGHEQARFVQGNFNFSGEGLFVQGCLNQPNTMYGSLNSDHIIGGYSNDIIEGRQGNDTLTGNGGNDTFLFQNGDISNSLVQTTSITDFTAHNTTNDSNGDVLQFDQVLSGLPSSPTESDIEKYFYAEQTANGTELFVNTTANTTAAASPTNYNHVVLLEGVTFAPTASSTDILHTLISQSNLVVHA
jgi:uncharacterized repeat protein (TIGR01451 family)